MSEIKNIHEHASWFASYEDSQLQRLVELIKGEIELTEAPQEYSHKIEINMKTEQVINIHDLRKLLPERAQIEFRRKKGKTGRWYLEIEVSIKPSISEKEHDIVVQKIIEFYGEDCLEVYTEDTGRWFYVYLRMSSTVPTTVIP